MLPSYDKVNHTGTLRMISGLLGRIQEQGLGFGV